MRHLYMMNPNPESEEMKDKMLAWYREEHLERFYKVEGMMQEATFESVKIKLR